MLLALRIVECLEKNKHIERNFYLAKRPVVDTLTIKYCISPYFIIVQFIVQYPLGYDGTSH